MTALIQAPPRGPPNTFDHISFSAISTYAAVGTHEENGRACLASSSGWTLLSKPIADELQHVSVPRAMS